MKPNRSLLLAFIIILASGCYSATNAQSTQDNPLLYELLDRIELLERELRQLRGDLEVFQHRQNQQAGFNNNTNTEPSIERRLQALEQALGPGRSSTALDSGFNNESNDTNTTTNPGSDTFTSNWQGNTRSPSSPPPNNQSSDLNSVLAPLSDSGRTSAPAASGTEQDAYNQALEQLRGGQYQQATTGFQTFINNYPNSSLTGNAYYWLGEAYYVNRDFEKAKQSFLTLGTRYPDSEKLPDTLLKLGYSYSELGETERAKQVLSKLVETFPDNYAANLAEKHLRLLR